jgi:hypothetical protein
MEVNTFRNIKITTTNECLIISWDIHGTIYALKQIKIKYIGKC